MRTSIAVSLTALVATTAFAAGPEAAAPTSTPATPVDQSARIAALENAVSELMKEKGENWLTEQRATDIKKVVQDVLADTDTRASLQGAQATSGYADGFFVASPDGNFKLKINGDLQFRWAYNWLSTRDMTNGRNEANGPGTPAATFNEAGVSKAAYGFEVRRAKLEFSGHFFDPSWQYATTIAYQQFFGSNQYAPGFATGSASTAGTLASGGGISGGDNYAGGFSLENAWIARDLGSGFKLMVGQFKSPLLREWLVSSKGQLAAERSIVTTLFNTGWTQGMQLNWQADQLRTMLSYNDGANNANLGATSGTAVDSANGNGNLGVGFTQWAFTGRVEYLPFGNWAQFTDYSSMRGETAGLMLGAGINWQRGGQQRATTVNGLPQASVSPGSGNADANFFTWTADASYEFGGASVSAMWMMNTSYSQINGQESINSYGAQVQGAFFVTDTVELFARWEWMETARTLDNASGSNIAFNTAGDSFVNNIGTVGGNWYIAGRALKFTTDVGVSWNPL
ncbi:MAG: porin, partial [Planctomycetota bacterium]